MKIDRLVDTNILIYAYDSASVFHRQAMTFLEDADINLYITSKNISEFFAVLSKQGEPFSKIFLFYEDIIYNSTTLFPTTQSLDLLENLLQKYQPRGNRVFDIEIVSMLLPMVSILLPQSMKKIFGKLQKFHCINFNKIQPLLNGY